MNLKNYYPWILAGLLWIVALLNYMDRQMLAGIVLLALYIQISFLRPKMNDFIDS